MNKRRIELWLIDTAAIIYAYVCIFYLVNLEVDSMRVNGKFTLTKLVVFYLCIMFCRLIAEVYENIWRYANVTIYLKLMAADTLGGLAYIAIGHCFPAVNLGAACGIILTMSVLLITLCSRFVYQLLYAYVNRKSDAKIAGENRNEPHKINIGIVGAGNIGVTLARELSRNPQSHYNPYCFIDKDIDKIGNTVSGIRIYPEDGKIVDRIKEMPIQEIVIALPDATAADRERLYNLYQQTGCKVKLYDYPLGDETRGDGRKTLREFHIEDLLFRDSLFLNSTLAKQYYAGKTILVTGGGGSIGSELCRQIARLNPKKLIILDIYENNAYSIQQELIGKYGDKLCLDTIIASVRDVQRLDDIFNEIRPEIVFHAAAHKHVPLMERSACEAIKNNVMGTYHVANMAEKYGVEKFLLISTDKAVNPTNIMGASKCLCEMIIQCRKGCKTEFTAVRFGNVLGSNGSVIPLFKKQIEAGGPITLTDKRIVRYFMTIPEAVGLVMETAAMAKNGELFVLDMGNPVRILDLAENMIRLSGLRPYEDIDIVEIGLRPGEKLYEELLMKNEELDKTPNDMIFIERDKGLSREEVEAKLEVLLEAVETGKNENVVSALRRTVPTYQDPEKANGQAVESEEMNRALKEAAVTVVG